MRPCSGYVSAVSCGAANFFPGGRKAADASSRCKPGVSEKESLRNVTIQYALACDAQNGTDAYAGTLGSPVHGDDSSGIADGLRLHVWRPLLCRFVYGFRTF